MIPFALKVILGQLVEISASAFEFLLHSGRYSLCRSCFPRCGLGIKLGFGPQWPRGAHFWTGAQCQAKGGNFARWAGLRICILQFFKFRLFVSFLRISKFFIVRPHSEFPFSDACLHRKLVRIMRNFALLSCFDEGLSLFMKLVVGFHESQDYSH